MTGRRAFLYILGIIIIMGMVVHLGWEEIVAALSSVHPLLLVFLCVFQVGTLALTAYQWHFLVRKMYKGLSFPRVWSVYMAGSFVESVTPSVKLGGEAAKLYFFRQITSLSYRQLAGMFMAHKYISLLPFLLICFVFLLLGSFRFQLPFVTYFSFLVFALLFVLFLGVTSKAYPEKDGHTENPGGLNLNQQGFTDNTDGFSSQVTVNPLGKILKLFSSKTQRAGSFLVDAAGHSRRIVSRRERCWLMVISLLVWGTYPLKVFLITSIMGLEVTLVTVAIATYTAYLVSMVPLLPGGLGAYEGSMVFMLSLGGVAPVKGLAVVLLSRFITYWFPLMLSGVWTIYFTWKRHKKKREVLTNVS